ncbi:MAG: glutathione S-transferase family protein [Alphaproteobacteria bacterium]|nr:glutathione S-transferase family protein [Alphaproteobacteria bacterium]
MPEAITLFGNRESGNCWKGKWTADLLGVPCAWVEIDIFKGESRTPDFLAMNPAGQAPVARLADGRTLAQSNAIMLFLAEGSHLVPSDPFARAKMYEWLFWEQYNHEPTIAVRRAELKFRGKTEETVNPALLEKGETALARMELALKETSYLVGEALTLADIACVAYTRVAHEGGFDLAKFPHLQAWVARVERNLGLVAASEAA